MSTKICVIGAGPGGYVAAIRAAKKGAEVTVIEKNHVGGTCLNHGCIPSKLMIKTAELIEKFKKAGDFGIQFNGDITTNITQLMERKHKVINDQAKGIHALLKRNQVTYVKGSGSIKANGALSVKTEENDTLEIKYDKLIIASGTTPASIPGFPFDGEKILSSNDILNLKKIPESILIVGGGVIGCEFAFILSSLGSRVTVVEAMDRLLPIPSVDEDCSKVLQREMKKKKIKFLVNQSIEKIKISGNQITAIIDKSSFAADAVTKNIKKQEIETEKILICVGRKPNTSELGIDKSGIRTDEKGWINVNDRMETNIEGVYAIGDILGPSGIMLAHVASKEGIIAAENAMGNQLSMDYTKVPNAIFTMPEIGCVGLSESQAIKENPGKEIRADSVLFRTIGKAQVTGEIAGQAKIVSNKKTGEILGIHIIGSGATELVSEGTLALQKGCTVKELSNTIHAHPTLSEIMLEVSYKASDQSLHG